jgi:xanthine dehydrogenase molybdopterin-binding subunit B
MPVALVIANTEEAAKAAVNKIKMEVEPLEIITDPREAKEKGELIIPPRTFQLGDTVMPGKTATIFLKVAPKQMDKSIYTLKHKALMFCHKKTAH